ncbi:hypothetical protein MMU07_03120 [Aquiflexum sp. LQ15W]|uniref:hypothetical protein n=1 Tax=Cognataquiflexum nitidum TaxID=2922272 RepID=UPI001F142FD4|nr:hypothetical protein [Cognataquiflexum nitidum]MCH6198556.1 hypothetical protein [Cognataquiflexum nitidum]
MTLQSADKLIYDDKTYYIYAEPLSDYLKQAALPYPLVAPNTACWRGYSATYTVQGNKLFLTEWKGYIRDFMQVGIDYLFPGESFVFADWFTGSIKIKQLGEYIAGSGPFEIHEGQLGLEFEQGIFIKESEYWLPKEDVERIRKEENDMPF